MAGGEGEEEEEWEEQHAATGEEELTVRLSGGSSVEIAAAYDSYPGTIYSDI